MTRVYHVTQPTTAGVARCVRTLARLQHDQHHNVTVISPDDGDLRQWLLGDGVRWLRWQARRDPHRSLVAEVRRLRTLVPETSCDAETVIHLHSSKAGLAGRLAFRRYPARIVFQPHGWSFLAASGPQRRLALWWERVAARWATTIVAVSVAEAEVGRRERVTSNSVVIPNAVEVRHPSDDDPDQPRRGARDRLGLPDTPTVICIGRLAHQKGQDLLLAAWPQVLDTVPSARLYLLGDGPLRRELEALDVPQTSFQGWLPDVGDWLDAANLSVSPSRWEGMSLGVLESMAAARSVVATDVEGMRELLMHEDPAGAVVPLGDTRQLALAISARLLDATLADQEGAQGRRTVENHYSVASWERAVLRLLEPK